MNILQLVFKQMRQRALSTWLTMLAVLLGVALAVALMITMRGSEAIFGQSDYGYDVIVGPKGSPTQLVLNTVYHLDKSPGNIPYSVYEEMVSPRGRYRPDVRTAVPTAVGDSYKGLRIIGAPPKLFGLLDDGTASDVPFEYRPGKRYEIAEGAAYASNRFEAVVGSDVPRLAGLKRGDTFQATHGMPAPTETPDIHDEVWKVVGVMKPTHTAADKCIYIPLLTFYCIFEHEESLAAQSAIREGATTIDVGSQKARAATKPATTAPAEEEKHYVLNADGTIDLKLPKNEWMISAILVKSRSPIGVMRMIYDFGVRNEATAVNPASVMREFFDTFLRPSMLLLQAVSWLVMIVAAVSILVSIYNSVSARKREIAILRALGATRLRIVTLLCLEAGLIGLFGGILGIIAGHLLGLGGSIYMQRLVGEGLPWMTFESGEWIYLLRVVMISLVAGVLPALNAYRTPVATNLVSVNSFNCTKIILAFGQNSVMELLKFSMILAREQFNRCCQKKKAEFIRR